jgi:hypothetical protein
VNFRNTSDINTGLEEFFSALQAEYAVILAGPLPHIRKVYRSSMLSASPRAIDALYRATHEL